MTGQGMIPRGPRVRLKADVAAQPERYARIDAYLQLRAARRVRRFLKEERARQRAQDRPVPCAICGGPTSPWDRFRLPDRLAICIGHHRRMCGYFPLARGFVHVDLPEEMRRLFMAARIALYVLHTEILREERHGKAV